MSGLGLGFLGVGGLFGFGVWGLGLGCRDELGCFGMRRG